MNTTVYVKVMMNNVDWNDQALDFAQGFGLTYTFLNKRRNI